MNAARRTVRSLFSLWLGLPAAVRYCAPILVMSALWLASSSSPSARQPNLLGSFVNNTAHVVAWFVLAGSWALALGRSTAQQGLTPRVAAASVLLSLAYGVIDEVHQSYVPGRSSTVWDVCSDLCGAAIAVAFVHWTFTGRRRAGVVTLGLLALGMASAAVATWVD